jgi:hypothetical protein
MDEYEGYWLERLTMTRVRVVLYPNVLTTVGKNELNPQAAYCVSVPLGFGRKSNTIWSVWNRTKRASLGSVRACLKPAMAPRLSWRPTVSFSILECARSL